MKKDFIQNKLKWPFLLCLTLLWTCEKDDICPETTQTTPLLVVEFNDFSDPEAIKFVPRMTLYAEDLVSEPPTGSTLATLVFDANTTEVNLPLQVNEDGINSTVRYVLERDTNLRLDDDASTASNADVIQIQYTSTFEYVSRACGYKSNFTIINITIIADDDNWIEDVEVLENSVTNQNTTHVRIFH